MVRTVNLAQLVAAPDDVLIAWLAQHIPTAHTEYQAATEQARAPLLAHFRELLLQAGLSL